MPDNQISQSTDKPILNASEAASRKIERAGQAAEGVANVAADKVRQAGYQLDASATSVQSKATSLQQDLAAKLAPDHLSDVARTATAGARQALGRAADEGAELLHEAQDAVVDTYESARDYATDAAQHAAQVARRAGQQTLGYARRTGRATSQFAGAHTLPLLALGASVGWLAWSVRRESSRRNQYLPPPAPSRLETTLSGSRSPSIGYARTPVRSPASTTSGAKLMGVRVNEVGYDDY